MIHQLKAIHVLTTLFVLTTFGSVQAATNTEAETAYLRAVDKEYAHQYESAFQDYTLAANQGFARAWYKIAWMYKNRNITSPKGNDALATEAFTKAFNGLSQTSTTDAEAQFVLGRMLYEGLGTQKNLSQAKKWYEKSAMQGFAKSELNLGLMLLNGYGGPKNLSLGLEWIKKAQNHGIHEAHFVMGVLSIDGQLGVKKDAKAGITFLQKAIEAGSNDAIHRLAAEYESGTNTKKDEAKARKLYEQGASYEHPLSLYKLGWYYYDGRGGLKKDAVKAAELFARADAKDFPYATNDLAVRYATGDGVKEDMAKAVQLYRKAAELGVATAQFNYGMILLQGEFVIKNEKEGFSWMMKSAKNGETRGMYTLGQLYWEGRGTGINRTEGLAWQRVAGKWSPEYLAAYSVAAKALSSEERKSVEKRAEELVKTVTLPTLDGVTSGRGTSLSATPRGRTR